jgi:hypothetical protein
MASARQRGNTWTGYWREDGKQKTLGGFPTEKSALDHALLSEALAKPRSRRRRHPPSGSLPGRAIDAHATAGPR